MKEIIKDKGLNQRELAKIAGVSERTLNTWIAGEKIPRLDTAILVASTLGIDLETLAKSLGLDVSRLSPDSMTSQ